MHRLGPIVVLANRAAARGELGQWQDARVDFELALHRLEQLTRLVHLDRVRECRAREANMRNGLALVRRNDDLDAALMESDSAINICIDLLRERDHADSSRFRKELAGFYFNRASTRELRGEAQLALEDFNRAVDIAAHTSSRVPTVDDHLEKTPILPMAYYGRGNFLMQHDRLGEAIDDFDAALVSIQDSGTNDDSASPLGPLMLVCRIYRERGGAFLRVDVDSEAGLSDVLKATELLSCRVDDMGDRTPPELLHVLAECYHGLGFIFEKRGDPVIALIAYDHAVQLHRRAIGEMDIQYAGAQARNVAGSLAGRGRAWQDQGKLEEAIRDLHAAESMLLRVIGDVRGQYSAWVRDTLWLTWKDLERAYQALEYDDKAFIYSQKAERLRRTAR